MERKVLRGRGQGRYIQQNSNIEFGTDRQRDGNSTAREHRMPGLGYAGIPTNKNWTSGDGDRQLLNSQFQDLSLENTGKSTNSNWSNESQSPRRNYERNPSKFDQRVQVNPMQSVRNDQASISKFAECGNNIKRGEWSKLFFYFINWIKILNRIFLSFRNKTK